MPEAAACPATLRPEEILHRPLVNIEANPAIWTTTGGFTEVHWGKIFRFERGILLNPVGF